MASQPRLNRPLSRVHPNRSSQASTQRTAFAVSHLNYAYSASFRGGRITERIKERLSRGRGKISFADMQGIQADVILPDAQVFVPFVTQALANARASSNPLLAALVANPAIASAVNRLSHWGAAAPRLLARYLRSRDPRGRAADIVRRRDRPLDSALCRWRLSRLRSFEDGDGGPLEKGERPRDRAKHVRKRLGSCSHRPNRRGGPRRKILRWSLGDRVTHPRPARVNEVRA